MKTVNISEYIDIDCPDYEFLYRFAKDVSLLKEVDIIEIPETYMDKFTILKNVKDNQLFFGYTIKVIYGV